MAKRSWSRVARVVSLAAGCTLMVAEASAQAAASIQRQSDVSMAAAQVELLYLRSGVPRRTPTRGDSLWVDGGLLSRDSATKRLARMSKPAVCKGTLNHDTLRISCQRLQDLPAEAIGTALFPLYAGEYGSISSGGMLREVRKNHPTGFDTLRVVCAGRDTIVVPALAIDAWERDYMGSLDMDGVLTNSGGGNDLDHELTLGEDYYAVPLGRRYGAVSAFQFSSSLDAAGQSSVIFSGSEHPPTPYTEEQQLTILAAQMNELTFGSDEARLRPALAK